MALPFTYNVRNVFVRWRTTGFTVLGVTLVVAVYVLLLSMAAGIEQSNGNTGDPRNILIVRKGSTAESSSLVSREHFRLIPYMPEVAQDAQGRPLASADLIILISLPRRDGKGEANVVLRGISPLGMELRPQVKLATGRWFIPGKREIAVSTRMAGRFANFGLGQSFKTSGKEITVVGWFDGGGSAFDSEIWMDADEARAIFDRENYSSILVRMANPGSVASFTNRIETDKRLSLRADPEVAYYASQTKSAGVFVFLGNFLAIAMSIGAIFAAMNTMYASVGARTREIGTLRVLGYRRRWILLSFIIEGAFLALIGGVLGCIVAWALHLYFGTTATMNFESFSEMMFRFRITTPLVIKGMIFSVLVGIFGSLLPAIRASRLPVIAALKSA
ncbi:MAG: putative transport system permease protein [Verrucomicrobiota bacterium]|jgi:putative ABC transport system permease protein